MTPRFISCPDATILDAIQAVMACVPRPWTDNMLDDAVTVVMDVADQWRGTTAREVDLDEVYDAFVEERLGGVRPLIDVPVGVE